eukprot:3413865-Pyramimonas_sp.AAC.1
MSSTVADNIQHGHLGGVLGSQHEEDVHADDIAELVGSRSFEGLRELRPLIRLAARAPELLRRLIEGLSGLA